MAQYFYDCEFTHILADDVVLMPGSEEGYLMRSVRNRCLNLIAHKSVKERVAKLLLADADVILSDDMDERLEQLLLLIDDLEPPIRKQIFNWDKQRSLQQNIEILNAFDRINISYVNGTLKVE